MAKSLLIIGAGGHGQVVREVAEACGYGKIGLLDDNNPSAIGKLEDLERIYRGYEAVFAGIGNNTLRGRLIDRLEALGADIPVLVHPTAYVSPSATIGRGTVVEPKALVNANTTVGRGCIISVGAIVDHDVAVQDFAHVNAGAICKAGSVIDTGTKLEAGQVVIGYHQ